jgi:hypothetical protein
MNNYQAWLQTVPILFLQGIILLIFTLLDPPRMTEGYVFDASVPTYHLLCEDDLDAFTITQAAFDFCLTLVGYVLALTFLTDFISIGILDIY